MKQDVQFSDYCKKLSFLELIPYLNDEHGWKRSIAVSELEERKSVHKKVLKLAFLFARSKDWKLRESSAGILSQLGLKTYKEDPDRDLNPSRFDTNTNNEIANTLIQLAQDKRVTHLDQKANNI